MDNRRDFLKKSLLLSGAAGFSGIIPASIQKAFAINPAPNSTYLDAEHVVILMQENRSFDHCFGSMKGVRGFNDPRVFTLPDKNPVWLQTGKDGKTFAPFRLDIKNTKITWMGSVPHSRESQVDAWNDGRYDGWIDAKRPHNPKFAEIPMTMGYYTREDLPFNYALADAFTICDQNFCSGMTSTTPNRSFFWTGTIRAEQNPDSFANIRNYNYAAGKQPWATFPELLEKNNISWRFYQNEISTGGGFTGDERSWLANFGCNILEFFKNYQVKFASKYVQNLQKQSIDLPKEIAGLQEKAETLPPSDESFKKIQAAIEKKQAVLSEAQKGLIDWGKENFDKLPAEQKALFEKAFTVNAADPDYRNITTLNYAENNIQRSLTVPKGDLFYQFRADVNSGKLPTVSWLSGPQNFSDHPSAPWYGAWYVSEVIDILTKNPEVWKKTIFILTYDENDGYFDHVPPFLPPDMSKPATGKCSKGIDTHIEHIRVEQEIAGGISKKEARSGPVGMGFRVPMIVASPWSRGGKVCSEIFDHTSTLQFLEGFLNKKYNKNIHVDNISQWRRTVCGDLSSIFSPYNNQKAPLPFLKRNAFVEEIYNAKFKAEPSGIKIITAAEADKIKSGDRPGFMPAQEKGTRIACALPYQLYADGNLSADKKQVLVHLRSGKDAFGNRAAGSPFRISIPGKFTAENHTDDQYYKRDYAVAAGDTLDDAWALDAFDQKKYHLRIEGPNGFFREMKGDAGDPDIYLAMIDEKPASPTGNLILEVKNTGAGKRHTLILSDNAYGAKPVKIIIGEKGISHVLDLKKTRGWYDFSVKVEGKPDFEKRYAGRVETGKESITDPFMGNIMA